MQLQEILCFLPIPTNFVVLYLQKIAYLSGVTSSVSTQLNNQLNLITSLQSSVNSCAPKASPTFTGTVTIPGATSTGIISFPTIMTLATDISAARLILWPGTGND